MSRSIACLALAALLLATAGCAPKHGVGFEHYEVNSQSDPKPADEEAEWQRIKRERGITTPVSE